MTAQRGMSLSKIPGSAKATSCPARHSLLCGAVAGSWLTSFPFDRSNRLAGFGHLSESRRAFSSLTGLSVTGRALGFSRLVHTRFLLPRRSGWCPEWIWHLFSSSLCSVNTLLPFLICPSLESRKGVGVKELFC